MILYNVTVSIDPAVSSDWLEWMRSTHIPDVMATGCFVESRISRVQGEEEGGAVPRSGRHPDAHTKKSMRLACKKNTKNVTKVDLLHFVRFYM